MNSKFVISPASETDISKLYDLQLLAFESEAEMIGSRDVPALMESREHHRKDFDNWVTLKMTDCNDKIVGAIRYRKDGDIIEVGRIMVHPDYRLRGFAQQLISEVDKACPDITKELYTCTKSWTNIKLYEKMGYKAYKEVTEASGLSFVYMRK